MSSYVPDSLLKRIKDLEGTISKLQAQLIFMTPVNSIPVSYSNSGNRDAAHGPLTGLEVVAPMVHFLTGASFDQITILSSNIIIDRVGATALNLKTILNTPNDGVFVKALTVKAGKTLTLKTGGNLDITADIALTDRDVCYLVYSQDIGNKYRVITSKGSTGAGSLWSTITIDVTKDMAGFGLSNLNFIEFVNSDGKIRQIQATIGTGMIFDVGTLANPILPAEGYFFKINGQQMIQISPTNIITGVNVIPQVGSLQLGSSVNSWFNAYITNIILDSAGNYSIFKDNATPNMDFDVPSGAGFKWAVNGVIKMYLDIGGDSFHAKYLWSDGGYMILNASFGVDPTVNGEILRNGTDIKVFSGGAVRNLSLVGAYANQSLSNLTNPTSINQDLLAAASQNIGSSSKFWNAAFITTMNFSTSVSITIPSNNMEFSIPTGKEYIFNINGVTKFAVDTSNFLASNLDAQFNSVQGLLFAAFANGGVDPFANGMFELNGTNMKVMSGGVVKDFTQMPQLNANNTWTLTNTFNSTVFLKTLQFLILNSNDTSDTLLRQSTSPGVVPKKLDIECFGDVCFQAVGETSSLLSRGLVKAMQKAGDPSTTDIPAGYFAINKNTSSGAVKAWYNDGGTLKSITLT